MSHHFTPDQRQAAAEVWVARTLQDGHVKVRDEYETLALIRQYATAPHTSLFGMVVTLQCEFLELKHRTGY